MPGIKNKYFECILCSKRTKPSDRRAVNKNEAKVLRKKFLIDNALNSVICNKCRHLCRSESSIATKVVSSRVATQESVQQGYSKANQSPPSISLNFPSTSKTHGYCCVCKKQGQKLVVITSDCRTSAFIKNNVLIPAGNRCCVGHLKDGLLLDDELKNLQTIDKSFVNRAYVTDMLCRMREACLRNEKTRLDFDDSSNLKDTDLLPLIGINWEQFNTLYTEIEQFLKNTPVRSKKTSVAIYLCKMKSGLSNAVLSTLFNISKSSLRRAISSVRKILIKNFSPKYLGFNHISRQQVIDSHTRPLAQTLFGNIRNDQAILVLDGTYIFIEKSNNFLFQRRSYSMHKGRPLVKPMVIVTTTGYFISVIGPYMADAKNNDASILNNILKRNIEEIRTWVTEDDIFIVDRGFRDALPYLESLGIQAEMPKLMSKGDKQMSTEDANLSRLVTKVRWVVEAANSRIKRFKYFSNILPTNQVPYIQENIKNVCAISNKFYPPLSTGSSEEDELLGAKMKHLSTKVNNLKAYVEVNSLERRSSKWTKADSLESFPKLTEQELRNITCGSYQLKLSSSYVQEYLGDESDILISKDNPGLIKVKIQSRHVSSKQYLLWIQFDESSIIAWFCKCRAGARVVGVCSHIAAVIWYLGYARHTSKSDFGVKDWCEYVDDAQIIDQSDSDTDTSLIEE